MDSFNVLDDVFSLLTLAKELESQSRIEAATKYYEAIYLMKRYLERGLPMSIEQEPVKQLLMEKIRHYEQIAATLIADDSSTRTEQNFLDNNPRSPMASISTANIPISNQGSNRSIGGISNETSESVLVNKTASNANTKLATALDLDENGNVEAALPLYLEASELFLRALQAAENVMKKGDGTIESIANTLRRRLTQTLDRVEQIKQMKQSTHAGRKMDVVPRSRNCSISPKRIHENDNFSTMSQQSHLTSDEVAVLKRSSLIASGLFLPWSDKDSRQLLNETLSAMNNSNQSNLKKFKDPDGVLALSPKQKDRFHRWARPSEIVQIRQSTGLTKTQQTPIIVRSITPYTIQQQFVTDCSFIASLCICAALERRFRKSLITSVLHPQKDDGTILYNPLGKYMVKLWLNGVARSVVIDDYLPIDKYGNLLCSHTSFKPKTKNNNHNVQEQYLELWVCLIEKAYMKLCGGYNFPGSNSGVDMFSLTGWIPERIMFAKDPNKVKDYETDPERVFERIFSASSFGDCLITVSTELQLSEAEADAIGLVTGHAYAVLDVIQTQNGTRLLQLKNPWAHKSWKGRFSSRDVQGWKDQAFRTEVGYDPDLALTQDDGIFWVCWDDILKYFQNFHLSWNPWLFKYRLVAHGFWPASQGPNDDTFSVFDNPQYVIKLSDRAIQQKATVWILISRHITRQEQAGAEVQDFLTVHLHRNTKSFGRIFYPGKYGNCVLTGVYTNNPHVLVRYDVQGPEDEYLSVVLSQYKKSNDLGYTLSCFSTESFTLAKPEDDLGHVIEYKSSWTQSLCGGPIGRPTFPNNPTFAVKIPDGGSIVQLTVSTVTTAAVNVLLIPVRAHGDKLENATGEACIDSGNYRHGFVATNRTKVRQGSYMLIVSNYHPGEMAPFTLKILSNRLLKSNPIT